MTTTTGPDQLRVHLRSALLEAGATLEELPALVEEALWKISNQAGRRVGAELSARGFPVCGPTVLTCRFTLRTATTGRRIRVHWTVAIPPLSGWPGGDNHPNERSVD